MGGRGGVREGVISRKRASLASFSTYNLKEMLDVYYFFHNCGQVSAVLRANNDF